MKNLAIFLAGWFWLYVYNLQAQTSSLNSAETQSILYVLEEEKLANDVYEELDAKWNEEVFTNMLKAEQKHLEMVKELAEDHQITMPYNVQFNERGIFNDHAIQQLYDHLIIQGNQSFIDALMVGAKIEEQDIEDFEKNIQSSDDESVIALYSYLLSNSENHLHRLVKILASQGITYTPAVLTKARFGSVLSKTGDCNCYGCNKIAQ